jgi:hypothetical protein
MPSDNRPPYDLSKVSKFPIPGAHDKPGVVYVAKDCEPKDFSSKSCMTKVSI